MEGAKEFEWGLRRVKGVYSHCVRIMENFKEAPEMVINDVYPGRKVVIVLRIKGETQKQIQKSAKGVSGVEA